MIIILVYDTAMKEITLKALYVIPAFLLQNLSINSISKYHIKLLEGEFDIWKEGNINKLFEQGNEIQDRLKSVKITNDNENIKEVLAADVERKY